jgi:hypothetical protein
MSSAVIHRCHAAVISSCDGIASDVCHQLGCDYGYESFSGFEFRHDVLSDCQLRCHLLHESCSAIGSNISIEIDHIAEIVSQFFDLDASACPVFILCASWIHSNEQLLAQYIIPMICGHFPGVPIIVIQSDASTSKPLDAFHAKPVLQFISHAGATIPSPVFSILGNLLYACSCSWPRGTLPSAEPIFVSGFCDRASSCNSPLNLFQSISVSSSPNESLHNPPTNHKTVCSQTSRSSLTFDTSLSSSSFDQSLPSDQSPVCKYAASNAILGLSLKWGADGLAVLAVIPDSFAGRSGCFKVGDLILNVDGIDVASSRSSRLEAIDRLRQACDIPVQVCLRSGPGWRGDPRRHLGSVTLFQLGRSPSFPTEPTPVQQVSLEAEPSSGICDEVSSFALAKHLLSIGDSNAAATHLLSAARRNHPPACAMLASFYLNGIGGLPQNYQLAFSLARWSSLQKDPDGMGILACCFLFGIGTNEDPGLAYTFSLGCANESPHGQFCLGYMFFFGIGVAKDAVQSEK